MEDRQMPHRLLNAKMERLMMTSEECAEVIAITSKIFRHGTESHHPDDKDKTSNVALLRDECIDVLAMIQVLLNHGDIAAITTEEINQRMKDKLRYTHHQEENARWSIMATVLSTKPRQ